MLDLCVRIVMILVHSSPVFIRTHPATEYYTTYGVHRLFLNYKK